ncbi:hypothetical protein ACIHCX_28625 [Streptomyces sp. NPDC052043]|uniref:hypothetical protein n=1 Tax=Streptomyces sp. NPDC052043 TaxID=3365684 RepID=UPI0037D73EDE
MLRKAKGATASAASVVGMSVTAAPTALAIGNDTGPTVPNGTGASSSFGNSATTGSMSPRFSDTSTQAKRDAALSHLLDNPSVLSASTGS